MAVEVGSTGKEFRGAGEAGAIVSSISICSRESRWQWGQRRAFGVGEGGREMLMSQEWHQ